MNLKAPKGFVENIKLLNYFLHETRVISKSYIPLCILIVLIDSIIPFINIITPRFIIDELTGFCRINVLVCLVAAFTISVVLLKTLKTIISRKRDDQSFLLDQKINLNMSETLMNIDYENIEDPNIMNLYQLFREAPSRASQFSHMLANLFETITSCLTIIGYITLFILLVKTDTYVVDSNVKIINWIASNSIIWICLIVIINILIGLLQKAQNSIYVNYQEDFAPTERAYRYYQRLAKDYATGKDIRISGLYQLLRKRISEYLSSSRELLNKINKLDNRYKVLAAALEVAQTLMIYTLVSFKTVTKSITYGEFYLYAAAISNSISAVSDIISSFNSMYRSIGFYFSYKEIRSISRGTLTAEYPLPKEVSEILIDHVSFKYPGNETWVLNDISMSLKPQNRVGIVGINGAGKTTLVKLLLRLYKPTSGRILLNGVDIQKFNIHDYQILFSVAFQETNYFAYSIGENIAGSENFNFHSAEHSLSSTGLWDLVKNASGLHTPLTRLFSESGIILSGGESQKLALSRVLYKNSSIVIFDEPTAALDPLAEVDILEKYRQITKGKIALFISHRMTSCRFVDNIYVIDQGKIIENGSHEILINKREQYYKMWEAQSQHYNLGVNQ